MKFSRYILILLLAVSSVVTATGMPVLIHYCGGVATEEACAPDECCGDEEQADDEDACCTDEVTVVDSDVDAETPRKEVRQTINPDLSLVDFSLPVDQSSSSLGYRPLGVDARRGVINGSSRAQLGVFRL